MNLSMGSQNSVLMERENNYCVTDLRESNVGCNDGHFSVNLVRWLLVLSFLYLI